MNNQCKQMTKSQVGLMRRMLIPGELMLIMLSATTSTTSAICGITVEGLYMTKARPPIRAQFEAHDLRNSNGVLAHWSGHTERLAQPCA
jgi:hypothetical protein